MKTGYGSGLMIAVLVCVGSATVQAQDWPQFRGQNRDGKSAETGLLQNWPPEGPPLLWKARELGKGYSSVSVQSGRIYTIGDSDGKQMLYCLDIADGSLCWSTAIGEANEDDYGGSRSTPTVEQGRVYAMTSDAVLICADATDGSTVWKVDLVAEYGATLMKAKGSYDWQFAESPLVDEGRVIVTPGGDDATMVALNKESGDEIWRCVIPDLGEKGEDGAGYSSVTISQANGVRQYVQVVGRGVIGVRAGDGKFLWGYNRVANNIANIPVPVTNGNQVFASTGYQAGAALLELTNHDGESDAREVYFLNGRQFQNHHGGMILHDNHVYTGHGHNNGFPLCLRLEDGEVAWGPVRAEGKGSAAIAYADGHLYLRYANGIMILVEASPTGYREKGSFLIPEIKAENWSHPVIAEGRLLLKEQDTLHCYDIRATREESLRQR